MLKGKTIFITLFLLLSGTAYAGQNAYPIYVLTDANTTYGIINGMAALMNSSMFSTVMMSFALLGLGFVILMAAVSRTHMHIVFYVITAAIFIQFTLSQKVNVLVVNQLTQQSYAVANVPSTIAVPASWISQLGYDGAQLVDQAYSEASNMPETMTLTGGTPYSLAAQLMQDGSSYQIEDGYLRDSLTHFIVDCGVPLIYTGQITTDQLLNSNNVWSLFNAANVNQSLMTVFYGTNATPIPQGEVLTCPQAYTAINSALPKAQSGMLKNLTKGLTAGLSADLFQTVLAYNANNSLYNPTPGDYLLQAGMLNLIKGPVKEYMADKSHSQLLLQSLAVSAAAASSESNWVTSADVFSQTMGYIYAALQILIYAIAPILILFAIFPGAGKILIRRYLSLLAWFPMSFIMLAICNDLVLSWMHNDLGNVFGSYGGLAMASQAVITAKAAKMQETGAWLISVTPIIAWGIVSGLNFAITALLSHTGAMTFAHEAGRQSATGNMSLGEQLYNNTSANKFNTASAVDIGAMPVSSNLIGGEYMTTGNFGGERALLNGAPDMMSHAAQIAAQKAQSAGISSGFSAAGNLSQQGGFASSSNVGANASNSLETKLSGNVGGRLGMALAGGAAAAMLMSSASSQGLDMNKQVADQAGNDIAQAKALSEEAYKAKQDGDEAKAQELKQQSEGWFGRAIHGVEHFYENAPGWEKAAIGVGIGAAVVAAFATGVGEAATIAGGAAAGAAEIGGDALGAAAARAGLSDAVRTGMGDAEDATLAKGGSDLAKEGESDAAKAAESEELAKKESLGRRLLKGFSAGISEAATGSHSTNITSQYGTKADHVGQTQTSYSHGLGISQTSSQQSSVSNTSQYQSTNADFDSALGVVNQPDNDGRMQSALSNAQQTFSQQQYSIENASTQTQQNISALQDRARARRELTNQELKKHDGLNQLGKSQLQKDVGNNYVK